MVTNVVSSVGIVLTNKWVFKVHKFNFGTLLTVIHFVTTSVGLELLARMGYFHRKYVAPSRIFLLSSAFCGFVVLTNLSLQYNSVGFYQCAKVLTTPVVVGIQTLFYGITISNRLKLSLLLVLIGVAIATITDVELNLLGFLIAMAGVLVTSLYQIWVGTKQKELELDALQLLHNQAPISALSLLILFPFFDDLEALKAYELTAPAIRDIAITAAFSFFVNVSIYGIIGRTSPLTYNVVGHFKTVTVVILGFILFSYPVMFKNVSGILLTIAGIIWYTLIKLEESQPTLPRKP
ncbi:TPT-domain-containing protein [Gonapodya prolifera JEL478]|uniref:TPT-domain-containing protein n=1 Tax=Gonapodya prolifera (strain JEL478) TaxID=1344416 RepID=A0A139AY37_GONPJ|nr:TPT-domain-containing protein [Gonapodya prolifera JEL478]|eukprot:KXS21661.1 TPT-domain-containing protein [Gonapodya prolifera JEL478]